MSGGAAWHPDPLGWHDFRYWDGRAWTDHVSDNGQPSRDPLSRGARPSFTLPSNVVQLMERFGRHEIDPAAGTDDGYTVFTATQEPLFPFAKGDPERFVRALADACLPAGGWASYGASRTVVNLINTTPPGPDWGRLLDASNDFLRANFVPPLRIPGYAWDRFIATGGTSNTWITLRNPPGRESASITPFTDGETRRVAKLAPAADANLVLVQRRGDEYLALIDARWNDEDPTRSQSDWKRASNLYDLYLDIAWNTQVWDWADPQLEPFFPAPKAVI